MSEDITTTPDVGRRTILGGMAWAAPVIALAVAAPSASASPTIGTCGTDYTLGLLNQYVGLVTNTSSSLQVIVLAVSSTNSITGINIEDQTTYESVWLPQPFSSTVLNGVAVSFTRDTATTGSITMAVPAGASYSVYPDVSSPPGSGSTTLTPADGGCNPVSLVVSFA